MTKHLALRNSITNSNGQDVYMLLARNWDRVLSASLFNSTFNPLVLLAKDLTFFTAYLTRNSRTTIRELVCKSGNNDVLIQI